MRQSSSQSSSRKGHGGARPGAGHPFKPEPRFLHGSEIDADQIFQAARLGGERETIIVAFRVPRELLSNSDFVREFDDELSRGAAWLELDMLKERRALANDGKVSATLAGMRNWKGWDRADRKKGDAKANQQGALSDLEQIIHRVGRRR